MSKIKPLFRALTQRFGAYPLKDGQVMDSLERSWERAVGHYSAQALNTVVMEWCDSTKYARWPEAGEIAERLRQTGWKPEPLMATDNRPQHVKDAERDACSWHMAMIRNLHGGTDELPNRHDEQVLHSFLRDYKVQGSSFTAMLREAWIAGILPGQWEAFKKEWIDDYYKKLRERQEGGFGKGANVFKTIMAAN